MRETDPGSLDERDPRFIESLLWYWEWLYKYYFRVQTDGWHHIPTEEKVLLVGSHNGGLAAPDMYMMMYDWFRRFGTERLVYGLMHPAVWKVTPEVAKYAMKLGAVVAHPRTAIAALQKGASVLVYPGGAKDVFRPYTLKDKIYFAQRKGFIKLALRENVPIIPLISCGAHDSLIVVADCYEQLKWLHDRGMPWAFDTDPEVFPIYLGLPWGLSVGPLPNIPLPVQVYTRVCAPIRFERYGAEAAGDRAYVDQCYHQVVTNLQQELDSLITHSSTKM